MTLQKELTKILHLFPEYRSQILRVYVSDSEFRQYCDEYSSALDLLKALEDESKPEGGSENELGRLSRKLENELVEYLKGR